MCEKNCREILTSRTLSYGVIFNSNIILFNLNIYIYIYTQHDRMMQNNFGINSIQEFISALSLFT